MKKTALNYFILLTVFLPTILIGQENKRTTARIWMDGLLEAIKQDGLGPTIQSRNIYHLSVAIYDSWAVYDKKAETVFLGKERGGYFFEFKPFPIPTNLDSARDVTINYACYRLITSRFNQYSSKTRMMDPILFLGDSLMVDDEFQSIDYENGSPAALGNYIADKIIEYGFQDGAGDDEGYEADYSPTNQPMHPNKPGAPNIENKNRWQPLELTNYVAEKGWDSTLVDWNFLLIPGQDVFLTPHWGNIPPFAMDEHDKKVMNRDGDKFNVYNDPGPPPLMDTLYDAENSEAYKWNFSLVSVWGSHHDPNDSVMIDISPGGIGNSGNNLPSNYSSYSDFFNLMEGGCITKPRSINPKTGLRYEPNIVPRGDYSRVIAEYWVDGVNTYTPPGHWVKMLTQVSDHPQFEKRWNGKGSVLDDLEWDAKSFLALSGGLYDAGISAWSIKAYYDYIRPISAIRWMANKGQSSDENLPRYDKEGLPLIEGKVELVKKRDPLVGEKNENLNKIKVYSWRGPKYIDNVDTDMAGVGWILAENWWPYQRYSFATPPFAGFVSGHSTFSAAAAKLLELITGDPFFPGGIAEFTAKKNEFLEFEEGPSQDITLQWATYQDAADETCLSRIWGGIHPPVDDIPGRKIGKKVAFSAFDLSNKYFNGKK